MAPISSPPPSFNLSLLRIGESCSLSHKNPVAVQTIHLRQVAVRCVSRDVCFISR